jgi:hypothetical protein
MFQTYLTMYKFASHVLVLVFQVRKQIKQVLFLDLPVDLLCSMNDVLCASMPSNFSAFLKLVVTFNNLGFVYFPALFFDVSHQTCS